MGNFYELTHKRKKKQTQLPTNEYLCKPILCIVNKKLTHVAECS